MKNKLLSLDEYRNNPEFYFCKGLRCANKRNMTDAYKNLAKAAALEPSNTEYKFNMACFLSELQRPREANRLFNDILLNYDPAMFDCYFGLGCNYLEIDETEKAAENFDKYLYFDADGEFSQEVQEMIFYLKLYNNISHENKFLRLSKACLSKAKKALGQNRAENALKELYKSIKYNPLNAEARNLATLVLMEQQQYTKAEYINSTVKNVFGDDIWANCLCLYILASAGKLGRVNKFLDILTLSDINDRNELLCIATALIVFNKINELVNFLEMHVVQYNDPLIYAVLLLGYKLTHNIQKAKDISAVLLSLSSHNNDLAKWVKFIGENEFSAVDKYEKLFEILKEPLNYIYNPVKYHSLSQSKKQNKIKLNKKYLPVIECILEHREIMYSSDYKKEIIEVLNANLRTAEMSLESTDNIIEICSAVIEYIYCTKNSIEMEKEELIKKYGISLLVFNNILKSISREN